MNISRFRFILFNLKIFGEIVTTKIISIYDFVRLSSVSVDRSAAAAEVVRIAAIFCRNKCCHLNRLNILSRFCFVFS